MQRLRWFCRRSPFFEAPRVLVDSALQGGGQDNITVLLLGVEITEETIMDNLIGKKLDGRYQIESLVGIGGMANVYRGTDDQDRQCQSQLRY